MGSAPPYYKYRHEAMATEFEIIISQDDADETYCMQAAQAAFAEIDRLEDELSRFRSGSDLWRINHLTVGARATIGLAATDCLMLAKAVYEETDGAFDITVGSLMQIFRNSDGTMRTPLPEEEDYARERVGISIFDVEEEGYVTVHVDHPVLDLGAVGKGYALDQAAEVLKERSIHNAVLNAGDSSLLGIGAPRGAKGWIVTVGNKEKLEVRLNDQAVSGSGFRVQGSHIMNPRTLKPVPARAELVWASAPTAALSDALSTAFTIMSPEEIESFCQRHPEVQAFVD